MTVRHLILVGAVAGLLLAGFNPIALATNFTNGDLITYNQVSWGDDTDESAAALLLAANYNSVYASTAGVMEVGIPGNPGFSMLFAGAGDLLSYLPDYGPIGPLDADLIDPSTTPSGAFGAEVTALKLNIDFSDAGLLPGNLGVRFGDLVLQKLPNKRFGLPQLNGLTVRQFSVVVNNVLGGGIYGTYTIAELYAVVDAMNVSFGGGIVEPFATNNLAVPLVPLVMQNANRSGNSIRFTCSTTPTQTYQVQCITSLSQTNWVNLGSAFRATNYTTTVSDTLTNAQMFYRIAQLP